MHDRDVLHRVEGRDIGIAPHLADRGRDREFRHALHQGLARLPVGDEIGDGDVLELVADGEIRDLRALHHRAVVVDEFADHADRRQAREPAEIDRRLGMAGAHQYPALTRDQRKDMARPHEILRAGIGIGERAGGGGALLRRDAGGEARPVIHRDGEGGGQGRVVDRHHRIEPQAPRLRDRERRADDPGRMPNDEGHLLGRAQGRGDDEVALALAVVVVGDDEDLAFLEGLDGFGDGMRHDFYVTCLRVRRSALCNPKRRNRKGPRHKKILLSRLHVLL